MAREQQEARDDPNDASEHVVTVALVISVVTVAVSMNAVDLALSFMVAVTLVLVRTGAVGTFSVVLTMGGMMVFVMPMVATHLHGSRQDQSQDPGNE